MKTIAVLLVFCLFEFAHARGGVEPVAQKGVVCTSTAGVETKYFDHPSEKRSGTFCHWIENSGKHISEQPCKKLIEESKRRGESCAEKEVVLTR